MPPVSWIQELLIGSSHFSSSFRPTDHEASIQLCLHSPELDTMPPLAVRSHCASSLFLALLLQLGEWSWEYSHFGLKLCRINHAPMGFSSSSADTIHSLADVAAGIGGEQPSLFYSKVLVVDDPIYRAAHR